MEELQPLDILYHGFNSLVFFAIVYALLYKPMRRFMRARDERIATALSEAAEARTQATQLQTQYQARMAEAASDARVQAQSILTKANASAKDLLATASEQGTALLAKAREGAQQEYNQKMASMQDEISALSIDVAERILQRELEHESAAQLAQTHLQTLMHNGN